MMRTGYRHADRSISYPHAHNLSISHLSAYAAGLVDRQNRKGQVGPATVAAGLSGTLGYVSTYPSSSRMQFN